MPSATAAPPTGRAAPVANARPGARSRARCDDLDRHVEVRGESGREVDELGDLAREEDARDGPRVELALHVAEGAAQLGGEPLRLHRDLGEGAVALVAAVARVRARRAERRRQLEAGRRVVVAVERCEP
ncbi:MAG: hypothetical protein R3E88_03605 [Myxococcota bacterium]